LPIPRDDLSGLEAAHVRLLDDLIGLTDDEVRAPSLLAGWSVGHVLTHLSRNADGFTRMVRAASRGEVAPQYPGGIDQRAADIEAGAGRSAAEQLEDLRRSIEDLTSAWGRLGPDAWRSGIGMVVMGERRVADMPFRRWREVEVHHADLGRPGFSWEDWSEAYVERELAEAIGALHARVPTGVTLRLDFSDVPDVVVVGDGTDDADTVVGTRRWVLAWLTGRVDAADLPELAPWF
jgi:maleylpyruvate isomerase